MTAARYLGISPWELYEAPTYWTSRALWAMDAENKAQKQADKLG